MEIEILAQICIRNFTFFRKPNLKPVLELNYALSKYSAYISQIYITFDAPAN